ncbi:MAG: Uma2 family endonuclease [Saprospiraceae bacterium]|jgi:Uma2 family endonuclease
MATITKEQKQEDSATKGGESVSLDRFFEKYYDREDGWKYEWNDGQIEKTKTMNQEQTAILICLMRLFVSTEAFKVGGGLVSETDVYTSERQLRKPDIAFFSGEQVSKMKQLKNQIPAWVAEVISETDNANKIGKKNAEYFRAGVKVSWQIYPELQQIHVYTASDKVIICQGKTVCSGAPALPDFSITAEELFG